MAKLERMVATLVVALPSTHEGGALIVSHDGHRHEITFSGAASGCELSYAAFYADCLHEVRPLERGYRLCLTYNLTLAKSRRSKAITAPSYESVVGKIGAVLDGWRNKPDSQKLAILLDHRYTRDGLTLEALKGTDRAQAQVLFKAAQRSNCVAHLALITLWQQGIAECYAEEYTYRRTRNYRSWGNNDEDGDGADGEYEMGEIFETLLSADYWSDRQGKMIPFGEIYLDEAEIVTNTELDVGEPSEEDFEGYTGNAGMTLERWYHRAAVVIWPYEKNLAVLCEAGTDAAIGGLKSMVDRLNLASKADQEVQYQECQALASRIVDTWKPAQRWQSCGKLPENGRNVFVKLLCKLDNPALVRCFLSKVMPVDGEIQLDAVFVKLCRRHGWQKFEADLLVIIGAATLDTLLRNAKLLRLVCRARDKNTERLGLCALLCQGFVETLIKFDYQQQHDDWQIKELDRAALLTSIVEAMLAIDAQSSLSHLVDHALSARDKYKLNDTHLAAIFALQSRPGNLMAGSQAVTQWLAACRELLQKRTAQPPRKPADYRREHELHCNCSDCCELVRFLANPAQREIHMALNKQRRRHLHNVIDSNRCDLKHVTQRSGRPFTLVCTKTTASFGRAKSTYERDLKSLARILNIEKGLITVS